ncbi:MAG: ATP-binding protein [Nitrososphaerota archaeon]|nr:ATP-binding protein [Nitrososphaerota archaeon]
MDQNRFELEVTSKIDNLPVIVDFVGEKLTKFRADAATVSRVQLAVDEASTNIIKYAYGEKEGPLKLVMELNGDELIITLINWGKPFDPASIPPPDLNATLEDRKIGGLGMYLIRKLMDEVSHSFDPVKGNRLILKKRLH